VDRPSSTTILGAAKVTGRPAVGDRQLLERPPRGSTARTSTAGVEAKTEVEPFSNYLAPGRGGTSASAPVRRADDARQPQTCRDPALGRAAAGSAFVLGGDGHFFFTGKRD